MAKNSRLFCTRYSREGTDILSKPAGSIDISTSVPICADGLPVLYAEMIMPRMLTNSFTTSPKITFPKE